MYLRRIEEALLEHGEPDTASLRRDLIALLASDLPNVDASSTFAEVIAQIAVDQSPNPESAAHLIRFLSVDGLLPESNQHNQLHRNIVTICERGLPDICRSFQLEQKKQTYEKIAILQSIHKQVCGILAPLSSVSGDIQAITASRQAILQALNNGIVKAYCAPFGISDVRSGVDAVLGKLNQISASSPSLAGDIQDAEDGIRHCQAYCNENVNFLTKQFYGVFLASCLIALNGFFQSVRRRFVVSISSRLPPDNVIQKRYPLHQEGRDVSIKVPLRNEGPGTAIAVRVSITSDSQAVVFGTTELMLGNVQPGDFSAIFDALVLEPTDNLQMIVTAEWEEIGDHERKSVLFEANVIAQRADINWMELEFTRPYSTDVAKGSSFVGRSEKVNLLANKILRTPMEPFYVTGQKRVGKTSLALAATEFARTHSEQPIETCYLLWGKIAYEDPRQSLRELGERIAEFIGFSMPTEMRPQNLDFSGSLSPITRLADLALRIDPARKYVIIIDEFDEIHPELYMQGNLAETFFANIRAISTCENVCIVLIGGENMPFIMDRQGQKLNKFVRVALDYFNRDGEWSDFSLLVQKPTEGSLSWHEEAISYIFNTVNGNPYFAKILCASVFENAVRERDADITVDEVKHAAATAIPSFDTNSFAHLWQDGIYKPVVDREPDILRRCRVLVAIARTLRRKTPITITSIAENKQSASLTEMEITPTVHEFWKRDILRERDGAYIFVLPLFSSWLAEVGIHRLISDALTEELAQGILAAEEAAFVTSDEVALLAKNWPTYQGRRIGTDDIRAFYEQVTSYREQRLLFKILQNIKVYGEVEVREKLKMAHGFLKPVLPEFIQRRRSDRRMDVIITYVDGEGKSGQYYASKYAEENGLSTKAILSTKDFSKSLRDHIRKRTKISAIVIVDDIIGTGKSLSENIIKFATFNEEAIKEAGVPVFAVVICATTDGEEYVRSEVSKISWLDFDLRVGDIITGAYYAFSKDSAIWDDGDEYDRARALCLDLGSAIYRDNPLGFGGQGLLVVFPDTCPNNSLPILHSLAHSASGRVWFPLFPRPTN